MEAVPVGGAADRASFAIASRAMTRIQAVILIAILFAFGFLFAGWLWGPRDPGKVELLCARVDYVYQHATEITPSEEWRRELSFLKAECDALTK